MLVSYAFGDCRCGRISQGISDHENRFQIRGSFDRVYRLDLHELLHVIRHDRCQSRIRGRFLSRVDAGLGDRILHRLPGRLSNRAGRAKNYSEDNE